MPKNKIKPEWYVFLLNPNTRELEKFNVFDSIKFYNNLLYTKKQLKKQSFSNEEEKIKWLSKSISGDAMNAFWSKYEYEILITGLFCGITADEQKRIAGLTNVEYCTNVNLMEEHKVDVYDQLKLNLDKFIGYTISILPYIKENK